MCIVMYWHVNDIDNRLHKRYSGPHMIQLWDFGSATDVNTHREPYMTMAILHNGGTVWDMMWYPDGAWQPPSDAKLNTITSAAAAAPSSSSSNNNNAARLGVLAVAFGDGSLQVITIPHPRDVRTKYGHGLAAHDPVIIKYQAIHHSFICLCRVSGHIDCMLCMIASPVYRVSYYVNQQLVYYHCTGHLIVIHNSY